MAKTSHRMTLTQKILAAHARDLPRPWVQAGDVLQEIGRASCRERV